jgi:hypothetical protein
MKIFAPGRGEDSGRGRGGGGGGDFRSAVDSKVKAANDQIQLGIIGTWRPGYYHVTHLNKLDGARLVAACHIYQPNLDKAVNGSKDKPKGYKDYREVLSNKNVDAVIVATPLYMHFPVTRDALLAASTSLRKVAGAYPGRGARAAEDGQRTAEAGIAGGPAAPLQPLLPDGQADGGERADRRRDQRLRAVAPEPDQRAERDLDDEEKRPARRGRQLAAAAEVLGGLVAELGSHQMDIADWMFGSHFEFVSGVGGIDYFKDGRDVFDSVQLIFRYPKGQRLMASYISTNQHCALFGGQRAQFGECIMGTQGTIHITVGTDDEPALGMWYREPAKKVPDPGTAKAAIASASLASTARVRGRCRSC